MIKNKFKGLLIIIFYLFNVAHLKSNCIDMENGFTMHGAIFEEGTNRPLAFVNVGIAGKNVGTVSDINGAFNLNIPSANRLDTLTFSMVGYEPKKLALSTINTDNLIIALKAAVYDISEVIVSNKKFKKKTVGNKASGKVVRFSLGGDDLGAELGSLIKIRKRKTFIKTFKWFVVDNPFERVRFRLNIYDYKGDKPDSNILRQNIIVEFDKASGMMEVDLSKYNIMVTHDFIVSLEWFEHPGESKTGSDEVSFSASLMGPLFMYRDVSLGEWYSHRPGSFGIHLDIEY